MNDKDFEEKLPLITERFDAVLSELGLQGEIVRFMISDPENPIAQSALDRLDEMLSDIKADGEVSTQAWVCCDKYKCYLCEIA